MRVSHGAARSWSNEPSFTVKSKALTPGTFEIFISEGFSQAWELAKMWPN